MVRDAALGVIAGLLLFPTVAVSAPAVPLRAVTPETSGPRLNASTGCGLVNYTSTVDRFSLSYYECLPTGFSNSTAYPLAIFLHGLNETATTPMPGGYLTQFNASWIPIAASWGYILIVPNTRTGVGFYINSPFTGPQEQDVWDAIHSEESRRSITSLYLFGSSMGTMGTFLIAGQTPSAFAGIGAVLSFSDYFEAYDFLAGGRAGQFTDTLLAAIDNGTLPNQSATARQMWLALSGPRFDPQNFSGIRQYIVHGGNDLESSNNPAFWPYEQANDTVLNRSCLVSIDLDEPANCTQPLTVLHALQPSLYDFRNVYEPAGVHTTDELNLTDMFAFWAGEVPAGIFWSTSSGTPTPPPTDAVNFATIPAGCGTVTFGAHNFTWGELDTVGNGSYPVAATPCAGYRLSALAVDGNASLDGATAMVSVHGSAVVVATFRPVVLPPPPNVTFSASPATCGPIVVNGSSVANGGTVALPAGTYPVLAGACTGQTFANWTASGGVQVTDRTVASTTITVTGNGSVTAEYAPNIVHRPPPHYLVTVAVDPDPCGAGVSIGPGTYLNGSVANLTAGNYSLAARGCTGYTFAAWSLTGGLDLVNASSLDVEGNGSLAALLHENATTPGHKSGPPAANNTTTGPAGSNLPLFPLALVAAGVVAATAVAVIWRSSGRRRRSQGPTPPEG